MATPAPTPEQAAHNAATPALVAATPATAAAANTQQAPPNAATQPAPPATQRQPDSAAKKKKPDQAAKRKRETGEAELERSQNKRAKQLAQEPPPPTGSDGIGGLAGNKRDSAEPPPATIQPALLNVDDCFQFVRRAEKYITSDMSGDYNNVVTHAAMLTPTKRAALVPSLAHMIQEDQAKTLRLLEHSVIVAQHLMHLNR